jgi:hypothetical protein
MRYRLRAVLAAVASGTVIAGSVAACQPDPASPAAATSSAPAASTASSDTALDSLPFGSVGGGFDPLPGQQVASVPVGAGQTVTVPAAGQGGVPASGASAVALAVAVTGGAASGSVTVYPADASLPGVPSVSWTGRAAASGLAVSALSSSGAIAVHNSSAAPVTVTMGADGYWLAGTPSAAGTFGPLAGGQVARVRVGPGQVVTVPVTGQAGVPAGAGAVALTVGTAGGRAPGNVTVYPANNIWPNEPGLTWPAQSSAAGLVVTALSSGGAVAVRNSADREVTVTMDADGYWLSGIPAAAGTFGPLSGGGLARVRVGPGQVVTVPVAGQAGVPAGTSAVALAVGTTPGPAAGNLTVFAAGASPPAVPGLSWTAGRRASGLVVSELSSGGAVAVRNSAAYPVTVTLAAAGYWLSQGRVVSDITAKPTTVILNDDDITAVSGDPASSQTVTLAAGVPVPAVGRVLVAPISDTAPDGLLGTVTAVSGGAGGTHLATLTPATLDQAYSTFDVSTSQVVTDSDVVQSSNADGQTMTTGAAPLSGAAPARDLADQTSDPGYDVSDSMFSCDGSAGAPTLSLTADLSKMSVDLSLDANPAAPNIHFLITADPVFDINFGFPGTLTCTLSGQKWLEIKIPIPATPGLMVDIYPVVTLSAGGQASVQFQWSPRAAVGFDEGPGIDSEVHAFGSSGSVGISATASADLFLGFEADLTLAGRIGVGGDLGPDLSATYDAHTACVTVDGALKTDLSATANVFVKNWTFALATGIFDNQQLYSKCAAQVSPSTSAPSTSAPPSSGPPTGTTWTAVQPPLPSDADSTGYSAVNDVSCPSATSCLATGYYTDTSGYEQGMLLTWSEGAWTAAGQAPYAGNLSCVTASLCTAVDGPYIATWSSGTWTTTSPPAPADNGSYPINLQSVSCVSASFCVAAGNYTDTSGSTKGVLETWSDGTWTVEQAPLPADAAGNPNVYFEPGPGTNFVSCPSVSFCVAAGDYTGTSGSTEGVLETWSDGTWTATEAPLPADAAADPEAALLGLSCPTASFCLATGIYNSTSSGSGNLLETWSGGSWSATALQAPVNALGPVACVSASACVIANSEVLTSSGGSWTAAPLPAPPSGVDWAITNMACASASYCVAVGEATDATNSHWQAAMATGSG